MNRLGSNRHGWLLACVLAGCGGGSSGSEQEEQDTGTCGNSVMNPGEECDTGAGNSDTTADACRTTCLLPACGDGAVDSGEDCDDGATNSDEAADACRTDCGPSSCGDGVVDTGEECDDGSDNSDDDADACRESCESPTCGDGVADSDEECDDGDDIENNGCFGDCTSPALWTVTDDSGGVGALATDVAVDSNDNILVVGSQAGSGSDDILVRKYDPDGVEIWTQTFAGGSGNSIAVDSSDNVFVAGSITAGTLLNAWVRKYDPAGGVLWTQTYGPTGGAIASAIDVDAGGNAYAAGGHSLGAGIDIWVQAYDSAGNPGAPISIDDGFGDQANGIAVDPAGDLLIASQSSDGAGIVVGCSMRKITAAGGAVWSRAYAVGGSDANYLFDVAGDSLGNPVLGGELIGTTANDFWVFKLNGASGGDLWSQTYDGPASGIDGALAIATDGSDNVLATGGVDFNSSTGAALMVLQKRTSSGGEVWTWLFGREGDATLGLGVAADSAGNVISVGRTGEPQGTVSLFVRKYAP